MNDYQIVANKSDHTWELYCNELLVGTFSDLASAADELDRMETLDQQDL